VLQAEFLSPASRPYSATTRVPAPAAGVADEAGAGAGGEPPVDPVGQAIAEAKRSGKAQKVVERRGQRETLFAKSDATLTSELTAGARRVKRDGAWADIDLALQQRGGVLVPAAGPEDVEVSAGGDGPGGATAGAGPLGRAALGAYRAAGGAAGVPAAVGAEGDAGAGGGRRTGVRRRRRRSGRAGVGADAPAGAARRGRSGHVFTPKKADPTGTLSTAPGAADPRAQRGQHLPGHAVQGPARGAPEPVALPVGHPHRERPVRRPDQRPGRHGRTVEHWNRNLWQPFGQSAGLAAGGYKCPVRPPPSLCGPVPQPLPTPGGCVDRLRQQQPQPDPAPGPSPRAPR